MPSKKELAMIARMNAARNGEEPAPAAAPPPPPPPALESEPVEEVQLEEVLDIDIAAVKEQCAAKEGQIAKRNADREAAKTAQLEAARAAEIEEQRREIAAKQEAKIHAEQQAAEQAAAEQEAAEQAAAEKAAVEGPAGWTCQTCTFENVPDSATCEMCGSAKPAAEEPSAEEAALIARVLARQQRGALKGGPPNFPVHSTMRTFGHPGTVVKEYGYWVVVVRPDQPTLGSLVLICKEAARSFGGISAEAFAEQKQVISDIESVLNQPPFGYRFINYLMLMMQDPHVHYHVVPRYFKDKMFKGGKFPDKPGPPDLSVKAKLGPNTLQQLTETLKSMWPENI